MGYMLAVEPSALRNRDSRDLHQRVVWMNDALPNLRNLRGPRAAIRIDTAQRRVDARGAERPGTGVRPTARTSRCVVVHCVGKDLFVGLM